MTAAGPDERGAVAVELALGVGVLVLPVALLVLLLPTWAEHRSMATVAAQEAARTMALAEDWDSGYHAADALVAQIAANHGLSEAVEAVALEGELARGGLVTAQVTVRIPLSGVPFVGEAGGFTWTATHVEFVDYYRSFP